MDNFLCQRALEGIPSPVILFERDHRPVFVNQGMRDLLSRLRSLGPPLRALTRGQGFKVADTDFAYPPGRWPVLRAARGEACLVDDVSWSAGSEQRILEIQAAPMLDDMGTLTHVVALYQDVSHRRSVRRLPAVTLGDRVTRLPGADAVASTYTGARERMRRQPGRGVACVLLRVLQFDDVVVRHGVDVGDQVLAGLAERLRENMRRADHPHRVGPSTFLVVCEAVRNHMQAVRLARRLSLDLSGDYETSQGGVRVDLAAGASFTQDPREDLSSLTRRAGRVALEEALFDA